jgi:hypothetical protein
VKADTMLKTKKDKNVIDKGDKGNNGSNSNGKEKNNKGGPNPNQKCVRKVIKGGL